MKEIVFPGMFIKSLSMLEGSYFENSIIFIAEVNENGALGFVINRPFSKGLHDLVAYSYCLPFPFFEGGPVDQEHVFVIHQLPEKILGGNSISGSLFLGGDFTHVTKAINSHQASTENIKLFVGYCGWDKGELEFEIAEGSWQIIGLPENFVFTAI